jgi:hypothetical protein
MVETVDPDSSPLQCDDSVGDMETVWRRLNRGRSLTAPKTRTLRVPSYANRAALPRAISPSL